MNENKSSVIIRGLISSLVRTLVPIILGPIFAWLVKRGFDMDQAEVYAWLIPSLSSFFYVLVRLLETYVNARFGWLLGLAKQPGYAPSDPPSGPPRGPEVKPA